MKPVWFNMRSFSLAQWMACFSMLLGSIVLLGWVFGIEPLKMVLPGLVSMKVNTSICFILFGLALFLYRDPNKTDDNQLNQIYQLISSTLSLLVAGFCAMTLAQFIWGMSLGIDQLFIKEPAMASNSFTPGRMAPITALSFMLLGTSLFFTLFKQTAAIYITQVFTFLALAISYLALIIYGFGISEYTGLSISHNFTMALHTAVGMIALCMGVLSLNLKQGLMGRITNEGPGGYLLRKLLPVLCIALPAIRLLLYRAEEMGILDHNLGISFFVVIVLTVIFGLMLFFSKELNRFEQQLQLTQFAIQHSGDMVLLADENARILKVNPRVMQESGYTESELLGMDIFDLDNQFRREDWQTMWEDLKVKQIIQVETTWRHKSGRVIQVEVVANYLVFEDKEYCYSIIRNISDRKIKDLELQNALLEAKQASLSKSQFLANMSHEIRTPMNGILGMTEIIMNTELTQEQRRYLEMAYISGRSLMTIINDILDFSKIEAGKMELDLIAFKLRESLAETLYPFCQQAQDKGLELMYQIRPNVPNNLIGDPTRLRQVLTNLLGNALKFTHDGEIVMGIEVIAQGEGDDGTQAVELHGWVADTGIGMTDEQKGRIFEPFTQADGSTTRKFGGTGLGLSITRCLVEMMSGRIWVETNSNNGSTFHFTFIMDVDTTPMDTLPPVELEKLAGVRTLVIDDNATNLSILEELLNAWQMRPTLVNNGKEALSLMQQSLERGTPYTLVLLDAHMPGMDGFEVGERIKSDSRFKTTKIIFQTSYGDAGDAGRCRKLGIEGYLTKPIGQHELLAAIRSVLADHPDFEPSADSAKLLTRHTLREEQPRLSILLAEDNNINQVVAIHILQEAGHTVTIANNGVEALAKLKDKTFDVILMDVHMPEMDGFEATAKIREEGNLIPIIALTANAIKGDKEKCFDAGMNGYVSKPFQRHELLAAVHAFAPSTAEKVSEKSEPTDERSEY